MTEPPGFYSRKNPRMAGFDYSAPGAYFVTISCAMTGDFFGSITRGQLSNNSFGLAAMERLRAIPFHHNVALDAHIVMPDHVHCILILQPGHFSEMLVLPETVRPDPRLAGTAPKLGTPIAQFKQAVTIELRGLSGDPDLVVWHRSFMDHFIRDEEDLHTRRKYILENPARWSLIRGI